MIDMSDAYDQDGSESSDAGESDGTNRRASTTLTVSMFGLYVVGAGGLIYRRLDGLAAGEPLAIGVVLLLLAPLVAFDALSTRRR